MIAGVTGKIRRLSVMALQTVNVNTLFDSSNLHTHPDTIAEVEYGKTNI